MATAPRWSNAIVGAIKKGGLFAVDVDIVPTKIGQACHVWLPAATSGEMNLTSMNGERRMRLTERYMDPPGQAMPDCLIAARIANNMERVFREDGQGDIADKFKGFDWKTEEDAFMDGYHGHEKGGEFVTYERLRAMGTNGFQEPATAFTDGKIVGTKRLFADGKFGGKDGKATFFEAKWRGLQAPGKQAEKNKWPFLINNGRTNIVWQSAYLDQDNEFVMDRWPYPFIQMNPDDMAELEAEGGRSGRGLQRQRLDAGDGLSDADRQAEADLHAVRLPDGRAGQRRLGRASTSSSSRTTSRPGAASARSPTRRRAWQNVEHGFRRPAQFDAFRRDDDRPVDQDRMRQHEIDQLVVAPFGIGKPEFGVGRALFAQQRANRNSHRLDQFDQPRTVRRVFQIFDHLRLLAALPDHRQRVARRAAVGIVIDRHAHKIASGLRAGASFSGRSSHVMSSMPRTAPKSSAAMKPGRSAGRIPENVLVNDRAIATAGLANDVEAVNQYAAVI